MSNISNIPKVEMLGRLILALTVILQITQGRISYTDHHFVSLKASDPRNISDFNDVLESEQDHCQSLKVTVPKLYL